MGWWPFGGRRKTPLSAEQRTAIASLVAHAKYELIPLSKIQEKAAAVPAGAPVTVTASPGHGMETTLTVSEALAARGHDVTPHFSARLIRDRAQLADLLARARQAGLRKVFVVGGDSEAAGDLADGLALLRRLDEMGHPFDEIGVPAYPEGHVQIADDVLLRVLKEKQRYAQSMTTQMSFNPGAVAAWITRMRGEGVTLPVHLGVPGPMELTKLMTVAARIGVAESARYLSKNRQLLGHLAQAGSFGPDAFLEALASTVTDPAADVRGLHVFTMNQVAATAAWQRRMLDELGG
jgi:methylenetetrahydrofolate reductase (NADPH)